jgi:polysaccharide export outer membrane protein
MALHAMSRSAKVVAALTALVVLAGCAFNRYPPAPSEAATTDYSYKIGPLDAVNIIVWRNPELSTTVPVRPDGKISTALVADMQAAGLTPQELSNALQTAMTKYIRDPVVAVVVTT